MEDKTKWSRWRIRGVSRMGRKSGGRRVGEDEKEVEEKKKCKRKKKQRRGRRRKETCEVEVEEVGFGHVRG